MSIELDIEKRLGNFPLKVHFEAGEESVALLGASGCGKSMTLKCIAGIEKPDRGRIVVNGTVLYDSEKKVRLPVQKRRTGLMFQNYALFPNMTVRQNITAGTRRDRGRGDCRERVQEVMDRFGLAELSEHVPAQLSGGEQQRTALARILVSDPEILLLDEPFSALDSHLRFRMEQELREVIREFGKTAILVSHNRDEVFRLADKIAVMNRGQVDVFGTKREVFAAPRTRTACMLTGCKNISPIRKIDEHHVLALDWGLVLETDACVGDATYIGLRHHDTNGGGLRNRFLCDVDSVVENPFTYTVMLRVVHPANAAAEEMPSVEACRIHPVGAGSDGTFGWELDKATWERIRGDRVEIHIPPEAILLLKD